jgi:hypothetical protein
MTSISNGVDLTRRGLNTPPQASFQAASPARAYWEVFKVEHPEAYETFDAARDKLYNTFIDTQSISSQVSQSVSLASYLSQFNMVSAIRLLQGSLQDLGGIIDSIDANAGGPRLNHRQGENLKILASLRSLLLTSMRSLLGTNMSDNELMAHIMKDVDLLEGISSEMIERFPDLKPSYMPQVSEGLEAMAARIDQQRKKEQLSTAVQSNKSAMTSLLAEAERLIKLGRANPRQNTAALDEALSLLDQAKSIAALNAPYGLDELQYSEMMKEGDLIGRIGQLKLNAMPFIQYTLRQNTPSQNPFAVGRGDKVQPLEFTSQSNQQR